MAENKGMHTENIKKLNEIISGGKMAALSAAVNGCSGSFKGLKDTISAKLAEFRKAEKAAEKAAETEAAVKTAEEKSAPAPQTRPAAGGTPAEEKVLRPAEDEIKAPAAKERKNADEKATEKEEKAVAPADIPAPVKEEKPAEEKPRKTEEKPAAPSKVPVKEAETAPASAAHEKATEKPEAAQPVKAAAPVKEEKAAEPAPAKPAEKPAEEKAAENQPAPAKLEEKKRPSFIVRREEKKPEQPRKEFVPEKRPYRGEKRGDRPKEGGRPSFGGQAGAPRRQEGLSPKKPRGTYIAPPVVAPAPDKRFAKKKTAGQDKPYEEKRMPSKRALIKNNVNIEDFDENKSGYRKLRPAKKVKAQTETATIKIEKAVINTDVIPLKVLSEKIGITAAEITKRLFKEGIMKTINDSVDFDTAAFIADDVGVELEYRPEKTAEDVLSEGFDTAAEDEGALVRRPPVVTVMGHVDHGKTSILDRIRKTNVTAGEAGGITQHIGAYQVTAGGRLITFLDTPGHAAFTAMRARGAQVTDIAVLVVAADDGIMPQTVEAINHAKAADVPIIVAVNKIDKPEANIERVKTQLTENGLLPEEWGGDAIICPVSAKTGEGIEGLLESINLLADIKDLKANPDRMAKGVVIEAKLDQNRGPIATVLVQNGTLHVSDNVIVGTVTGKIRAMADDKGRRITSAGPSTPVSVMGLEDVPSAGDILTAHEQDKLIKMVAEERRNKERESMLKNASKVTLDDVFSKMAEGELKCLNIIVKADVQGSVEAVKQSMEKLSNDEVRVNVIHAAAGAIKESDIMLAESSHAIIIGFNVRPDSNAKAIAEKSGVDIRLYRVIYEAIEDVQRAIKGMLKPRFSEVYLGKAEVREVFKISGVGQVAGCYVTDGKIIRSGKLRIYRDDVMICEGNVLQLKRFKDDVKEVSQGFECGISIEKFNDIKVGDFIECYQVEENAAE